LNRVLKSACELGTKDSICEQGIAESVCEQGTKRVFVNRVLRECELGT